jgi:chitinase
MIHESCSSPQRSSFDKALEIEMQSKPGLELGVAVGTLKQRRYEPPVEQFSVGASDHPFVAASVLFFLPRLTRLPSCTFVLIAFLGLYLRADARVHYPWSHKKLPLVVGYFPEWGLTYDQPYYVKTLISNGSIKLLDQINYSQGSVTNGRCSVSDRKAALDTRYTRQNSVNGKADNPKSPFRGYYHQLKELKRRYPKLKVLISLEGAPAGFSKAARPENRQAFVASCIDTFLRGHFAPDISEPGIFDGFDIDWESPTKDEAADFVALIAEFRHQMDRLRPGLRLSIAVGDAPEMLPGTDFTAVGALVDQFGIMNYDYTGPWNPTTGFIAPLFSNRMDPRHSNSVEKSIASYRAAGVPVEKILMGLPFYGYSWSEVEDTNNGLFQEGNGVRADQPYRYIRGLSASSSVYREQRSKAPWLFDGDTFWTYDDSTSIQYKISYAVYRHLAGVMIWELSGDTSDAELLHAIHQSLRRPNDFDIFEESSSQVEPAAGRQASSSVISH